MSIPPIVPAEHPVGSGEDNGPPGPLPISIDEDQVVRALGDFLTRVLHVPVSRGQANKVPQPIGDYVIMTPVQRLQLSTTTHDEQGNKVIVTRNTGFVVQVDIYGPKSGTYSQIVLTLFQDAYGADFMAGYGAQPLYASDPMQVPLINGEKQYEDRWTTRMTIQANPGVSTPCDFADTVTVNIEEVA